MGYGTGGSVTDRPIIFSAPMVRALLGGRKTQTRRVLDNKRAVMRERDDALDCVRFYVGDRLYVREACKPIPGSKPGGYFVPGSPFFGVDWFYRADNNCPIWANGKWRPSIHMPRWASRLTLTVTEVRVQRLQDISEEDAVAEGVSGSDWNGEGPRYRPAFHALWNSLHGPDAWDANPWVVAVSFTVRNGNIDEGQP